jgi:hypothetical protein
MNSLITSDALTDADTHIRVIRDTTTGAVAIVLGADAADSLYHYFDGLGAFHDVAGDDADEDATDSADVVLAIRSLLRSQLRQY